MARPQFPDKGMTYSTTAWMWRVWFAGGNHADVAAATANDAALGPWNPSFGAVTSVELIGGAPGDRRSDNPSDSVSRFDPKHPEKGWHAAKPLPEPWLWKVWRFLHLMPR